MKFKDNEAKKLFLKYAIPCADEEDKPKIEKAIASNKLDQSGAKIDEEFERALKGCTKMAGGKHIDEKAIRDYFEGPHNTITKLMAEETKEITEREKDLCLVKEGTIQELDEEKKTGIADLGTERRKVNTKLLENLENGDRVKVHRDYACEKLREQNEEI